MGRRQQAGCGAGAASLLQGGSQLQGWRQCVRLPGRGHAHPAAGKAGAGGLSAAALLPPEWFCKLPRPGALCPGMLAKAPMIPTCSQEEAQPEACGMNVVLPPSLATEPTESLGGEAACPRSHSVFSPVKAVLTPGSLLAPLGHVLSCPSR